MALNNTFNPVRDVSFNPSGNGLNIPASPFGVTQNPYSPGCSESGNILKQTHHDLVIAYNNQFGQPIIYQPIKFNTNTHNFLYGDDPTSGYHFARHMKAVINFTSYTSFLSKFGMMSDEEMNILIPIQSFEAIWGDPDLGAIVPLIGDLFIVTDSACDRPFRQSPMVFQVTGVDDSENPVDYMSGHYVWKLTAKRFQYSYEPNAPQERFLDDTPSDTDGFGRMEGGQNPSDIKENPHNVDDFAQGEFKVPAKDASVYGRYN